MIRILKLCPLEILVAICLVFLFWADVPKEDQTKVLVSWLAFLWVIGGTRAWIKSLEIETKQRIMDELAAQHPWATQAKIMSISDQELPVRPTLTRTGILYGALLMEEAGETLVALSAIMNKLTGDNWRPVVNAYNAVGHSLQIDSRRIRVQIAMRKEDLGPYMDIIPMHMAKDLLDGCVDTHVVTAGLSNALGLPGGVAYKAGALSNLSKANPTTGIIDKTDDGKWIKGVNYTEPDLDAILQPFYSAPQ